MTDPNNKPKSPAAVKRTGHHEEKAYKGSRRINSGRQGYRQPKSMRELMIAIGWNPDDTTGDGRVS